MALTVVKYRKTETGEPTAVTPTVLIKSKMQLQQEICKKPIIKLNSAPSLIIKKLPPSTKPTNIMKRSSVSSFEPVSKSAKYSLQTVSSAGTPLSSFQWPQTIGGLGGTTITSTAVKKQQQSSHTVDLSALLPPNTIIQAASNSGASATTVSGGTGFNALTTQGRRPTILIKREQPKRTIRSITLELIDNNPFIHLGVMANRLPLLKKVVANSTSMSMLDCYITLKKLRQNEDFSVLGEYFEVSAEEAQQIFTRTVVKLSRYMRRFIRWPDSKKYYDRHKNLPFAFRSKLSHVQSLIECVETNIQRPAQTDCSSFKFILSITPNGIISYVSDVFVGNIDDLTLFTASNFQKAIPKYLSLVADPGKGIRRKRKPKVSLSQSNVLEHAETDSTTDSADESADDLDINEADEGQILSRYAAARVAAELTSHQTMNIVNSELTSRKVKDFTIPTMRVREPVCRLQIRHMICCLREYKMLQPYAIQEPMMLQYLNEIVITAAALTNLQR